MNELKRIHVLRKIKDQEMPARQGAEALGLSLRQMRRLIARFDEDDPAKITHGNRGIVSRRRIPEETRDTIVALARTTYRDYNDCHFTEELAEPPHAIQVSRSTVRRVRRAEGLGSPRKRRSPRHRQRRERRPQEGMMLQTDGSQHDWLEGRGPELTLIAFIDDATNEVVTAVFREEEDAAGYFLGLQHICLSKGIPLSIYADRHTIFQSPSQPTVEQELSGELPRSQFGHLLAELDIELIAALSPQAKGRIERLWETFQDRLVKELRKANASNREEANEVLVTYLPKFNRRFRVKATQAGSAYQPWPEAYRPEAFFCFKYQRTVMNDNTISFDGHKLQIPPSPYRYSFARAQVELHHYLDGRLAILHQGQTLTIFQPATPDAPRVGKFQPAPTAAPAKPVAPNSATPPAPKPPRAYPKPAANHPWRRTPVSTKPK